MKEGLQLQIVTPERMLLDKVVARVTIPEADGYVTVLPGHAALVAELGDGDLEYEADGSVHHVAITGGFLQLQDDVIKLLANSALMPEEIDIARAKEAEKRAAQRLSSGDPTLNYKRAVSALHRAETRLSVANVQHME